MSGAKRVGVVASECYFPHAFVAQDKLEQFDKVSAGKYKVGLGQDAMAFTGAGEDINSMLMNALHNLMDKYGLSYADIGRLEVGTETIVDKSKSSKTALMAPFEAAGNTDVLGVTNKNACYGGTAALFNTIDWVESSAWDGRYGVVLAGDIAVYERGAARPTGGAGVVALLVGPDAPLVFESRLRASHFEDAYDFYKPHHASEYPAVDGHLSNSCYLRAVDKCYEGYVRKFEREAGRAFGVFGGGREREATAQHFLFHQPYQKLVQKSFGRLLYNDLRLNLAGVRDAGLHQVASQFRALSAEDSYTSKELDKACVTATKAEYDRLCFPYTLAGRQLGNSYTGSLYFGLLSLIAQHKERVRQGDRVLLFSYGSGLAATMFSCRVEGSLERQAETCNLLERLAERQEASPQEFSDALQEREEFYTASGFEIAQTPARLQPGAFHLAGVDRLGRRAYARAPLEAQLAQPAIAAAGARALHTARGPRAAAAAHLPLARGLAVARRTLLRR